MEKTMDYNPVQLVQKLRSVKVRVVPDGINAYEQVAGKSVSFAIIKGDDVCVVVVTQILIVYFENLLIVNEKIAYFSDFLSVTGGHLANPVGGLSFLDVGEFYPLCFVSNHSLFFFRYIIAHVNAKVLQLSECTRRHAGQFGFGVE